jgi:hypothetical protein
VLHNWTDAFAQASFDDVRRGVGPELRRPHELPVEAEGVFLQVSTIIV